jgi:hypothetical protein
MTRKSSKFDAPVPVREPAPHSASSGRHEPLQPQ